MDKGWGHTHACCWLKLQIQTPVAPIKKNISKNSGRKKITIPVLHDLCKKTWHKLVFVKKRGVC